MILISEFWASERNSDFHRWLFIMTGVSNIYKIIKKFASHSDGNRQVAILDENTESNKSHKWLIQAFRVYESSLNAAGAKTETERSRQALNLASRFFNDEAHW